MRLAIPAPLFEGPFFYFVVESVNLLPSISASILSCCVSFIHMMIYSIMFLMFLVLHIALILTLITLKAFIEKASYLWTPTNYQLFFDQELSLPLPIMIHFMYLYCVSFTHYKLSYIIVSCLLLWSMYLMNVMLLVRIPLSTLDSINPRSCLLSSVSLGDKRSLSLGGVDTSILHHYSIS